MTPPLPPRSAPLLPDRSDQPDLSPAAEITIVIPTRNRQSLLRETLESVARQTFTAWRAVVVDNDSSDETEAMMTRWDDPRVMYIRQSNQGPSGGRNTGIAQAQTPWIAFLDSDDLWDADYLAERMDYMRRNPGRGLYASRGQSFRVRPDGGIEELGLTPAPDPAQTMARRLLREGNFIPTSSVTVATEAIRALGGFDPELGRSEDTDMWLRLALRHPGAHLPSAHVRYRVHENQTQAPEDRLEKLRRRIYICEKVLAEAASCPAEYAPWARRRLRLTWRERAKILTERGWWREAAAARLEQWRLRPADPGPLLRCLYCRLRAMGRASPPR
jgi:glycosyltransferase involved in cell wall biosynthesis